MDAYDCDCGACTYDVCKRRRPACGIPRVPGSQRVAAGRGVCPYRSGRSARCNWEDMDKQPATDTGPLEFHNNPALTQHGLFPGSCPGTTQQQTLATWRRSVLDRVPESAKCLAMDNTTTKSAENVSGQFQRSVLDKIHFSVCYELPKNTPIRHLKLSYIPSLFQSFIPCPVFMFLFLLVLLILRWYLCQHISTVFYFLLLSSKGLQR